MDVRWIIIKSFFSLPAFFHAEHVVNLSDEWKNPPYLQPISDPTVSSEIHSSVIFIKSLHCGARVRLNVVSCIDQLHSKYTAKYPFTMNALTRQSNETFFLIF